jgi:hypothetical protein
MGIIFPEKNNPVKTSAKNVNFIGTEIGMQEKQRIPFVSFTNLCGELEDKSPTV